MATKKKFWEGVKVSADRTTSDLKIADEAHYIAGIDFIPTDATASKTFITGTGGGSTSLAYDASKWETVYPFDIHEGAMMTTIDGDRYVRTGDKWIFLEPDALEYELVKEEIINKHGYIKMRRITEILEKIYEKEELRKTIVPLFIGNPGLGKTILIQEFAKKKGVKLVELITSQMSPFEISGIAMPDKEDQKMKYYNFDKLEDLKDGDILFFDELLNGNPVVLNACLTILEQRKFISGKDLPNIMIVAAANPQGMSPLTPQIKERFVWYNVQYDADMWKDYMAEKYFMPKSIAEPLSDMIDREDFVNNNFNTPRSIDKAVNMVINEVPTPYTDSVEPFITKMMKNPFPDPVTLTKDIELAPDEMISWLDLIKIKFKVK